MRKTCCGLTREGRRGKGCCDLRENPSSREGRDPEPQGFQATPLQNGWCRPVKPGLVGRWKDDVKERAGMASRAVCSEVWGEGDARGRPARYGMSEEPDGPSRTVLLGVHRVLQRWASWPGLRDRTRTVPGSIIHDASRARPSSSQDTPHIAKVRRIVKNKSGTLIPGRHPGRPQPSRDCGQDGAQVTSPVRERSTHGSAAGEGHRPLRRDL